MVADVGDADGRDLEVIDLVSQQVTYKAAGPFVGWANGDAFLTDGAFRAGSLSVRPTLISRAAAPSAGDGQDDADDRLALSAPGSCNACSSWTDAPMTLDLDNGIIAFPDTFGGGAGDLYELASGFKPCCGTAGAPAMPGTGKPEGHAKLGLPVASNYEVRPVEWKPGWNVRGGLAFSHVYDPGARRDPGFSDQPWYKAAVPLRQQLVLHRQLEQRTQTARIAGLTEGVVLRGDWRQRTRRARSTEEATPRAEMLTELANFGVTTAPPTPREAIPFSNAPGSEGSKARYATDKKKLEADVLTKSSRKETGRRDSRAEAASGPKRRASCRHSPMKATSVRERSS